MFIVSLTTVQDFDSTFKNYFAQVNACILNFKMSDLWAHIGLQIGFWLAEKLLD